jgi:hypothetical protein
LTASLEPRTALHRRLALAAASLALSSLLGISGAASASASTQIFGFSGDEQTYTVPAGVHSLHLIAVGAEGGRGSSSATGNTLAGESGLGARIEADLAVVPGQTLFIEVGGAGIPGREIDLLGAGGFNGGGSANNGSLAAGQFTSFPGGGGGGATDVRTCSRHAASCGGGQSSLDSRLLVAGGGGGSGALGGGGGYANEDGRQGFGNVCSSGVPGEGGLKGAQTAGGAGGVGALSGLPGTLGLGGSAPANMLNLKPGGGGGGGYFGGGAGGSGCVGGGGAGGSNFEGPSASNVSVKDDSTGVAEVAITPGPVIPDPKGKPKPKPKPSSDFSFGKLTRNRHRGTARLAVILSGPGTLSLKGKGLVAKQLSIPKAGTAMLPIKAKGSAKRQLIGKGKAKLKASITFTPSGDGPTAKTRAIKLVKKLVRPKRN